MAEAAPPGVTLVHGLVRPKGVVAPRDWYVPDDRYGWRAVVVLFGVLVGGVAALPWLVDRFGVVGIVPVVPIVGAYVYKLTILMHECCHRTLFRQRRTNDRVGLVAGGFLVTSYDGFCRAHWQHHRHCGTDEDGEESDYLTLQDSSPRRLVVHLLKPLLGAAALRLAVAATGAVVGTLRGRGATLAATAVADDGGEAGEATAGGRPVRPIVSPAAQLLAIAACQLAIAALATGGGRRPWLLLVYPATAATFGLFFSRVRAFCEHVHIGRFEGECSVRSHLPNPVDRLFFYTLNMNLHVEHHLFPQVPACHLPRVRARLEEVGYLQPSMSSRSIAGTIAGVLADARARQRLVVRP
jgi:fatty acid desaturase